MKLLIDVPEGYMVRVVKEEKDGRSVSPEWIKENQEHFKGVNLERELEKAKTWCRDKKRQCTRAFFVRWLNRVDQAFYREVAQADIMKKVDVIKARGWTDAIGWHPKNEKDAAKLIALREEWQKWKNT